MFKTDEIELYQSSPDGKAYLAAYALENAVDDICAIAREHPAILRLYGEKIATAALNLGCLTNALIIKEAAE